jgi:hypothetical protein
MPRGWPECCATGIAKAKRLLTTATGQRQYLKDLLERAGRHEHRTKQWTFPFPARGADDFVAWPRISRSRYPPARRPRGCPANPSASRVHRGWFSGAPLAAHDGPELSTQSPPGSAARGRTLAPSSPAARCPSMVSAPRAELSPSLSRSLVVAAARGATGSRGCQPAPNGPHDLSQTPDIPPLRH